MTVYPNYRKCKSQETLKRITPFLEEIGITRLANITGLDEVEIPVYVAMRPNSRSLSLSQGKGLTHNRAKVSALMETIESYHAETIDLKVVSIKFDELEKYNNLCSIEDLPRYKNTNFNSSNIIDFYKGKNILDNSEIFVPVESVSCDMRTEAKYFIKSSNGLASGNTKMEAENHAICELIERDAYTCWTLSSLEIRLKSKIDIQSINCSTSRVIIEKFEEANCYIGIWDITSDINVPAFLVRVLSKETPPVCQARPASGFGCHPDKSLALLRALTEAAQSRLTFISGARDDVKISHYRSFISQEEYSKWYNSIVESNAAKSFQTIKPYLNLNIKKINQILLGQIKQIGIKEIISVNLSKSQFNIPVVKVVIPGLEGGEHVSIMKLGKRAEKILGTHFSCSKEENYG